MTDENKNNKNIVKISIISIILIAIALGVYFSWGAINTFINNQILAKKLVTFQQDYTAKFKRYAFNKNCPENLTCSKIDMENFYRDFVTNEVLVKKVCGTSKAEDCFATRYSLLNGSLWDNLNTWEEFKWLDAEKRSVLIKINKNCTNYTFNDKPPMNCVLGFMFVDVNGIEKPNTYGRDLFYFYVTGTGDILPLGNKQDKTGEWKTSGKCAPGSTGEHCAARVIDENGWMLY